MIAEYLRLRVTTIQLQRSITGMIAEYLYPFDELHLDEPCIMS